MNLMHPLMGHSRPIGKELLIALVITAGMCFVCGVIVLVTPNAAEEEVVIESVDFDIEYFNTHNRPIDQISIMAKDGEKLIVADIYEKPYLEPNEFGQFCAIVTEDQKRDLTENGFHVIKVRTR